uniref:Tetratricopeptide repeat domain 4 n=1 Tax=Laticauda laticaudata TaxID=8630 RepID=A0A8C5SJZ2_LATLA
MAESEETDWDAFLDKFQGPQRYEGAFDPTTWEQEFDQIPIFMKNAPTEINPKQNSDLACLQSIIFDEEQSSEEQAKTYKNEGNDYFKEKDYKKAVISYTEGLKKKCSDLELNTVLHTNRAAAHFYLGALCHVELKHFSEAIAWCEEGLKLDPQEKKLLEIRTKADRLKRTEERDLRKAKFQEKKEQSQKVALLKAIKDRNIKLSPVPSADEMAISKDLAEMSLDGLSSESGSGAKVYLEDTGSLTWAVLFLYPEHGQTDFISAFHEESRFSDHLVVMFEESPAWDTERKYVPKELELYFEDEERGDLYQINPETTLLEVLQHKRYFVKAGTPAFLVLVKDAPFSKSYLFGKTVHQ